MHHSILYVTGQLFQSKHYQKVFAQHQLDSFKKIWAKKIDWFEEPNHRRGGWSGVGQLVLSFAQGDLDVFVKKQMNHGRRTILHPIKGEPTFRREYKRLIFLEKKHIIAPKVVFYGEEQTDGNVSAILITETLLAFEPLDVVTKRWQQGGKTYQQKKTLLSTIAKELRRVHETGLVHRALYPKHIFIKNAETQPEMALIDLEKARFSLLFLYRAYFDLSALNRHAEHWSRSQRLFFFLHYMQSKKLTKRLKIMCKFILRRSSRH